MKLHGLYSIISNKTIREHEKMFKRFPRNKYVPGNLIQTNRGYFIDGKNVDLASARLYQELVESARNGGITSYLKPIDHV